MAATATLSSWSRRPSPGETVRCKAPKDQLPLEGGRKLYSLPFFAYLKIAEGCDNCCAYCAIPSIRGRFRSRPIENIVEEAKRLAADGVTELVVVAQDTTRYGLDLYGEYKLAELLRSSARSTASAGSGPFTPTPSGLPTS